MARRWRVEYPGATHHVTTRGVARGDLFWGDSDRLAFLSRLAEMHERWGLVIRGDCLMTNHYHLEVESLEGPLSKPIQHLNQGHATHMNRSHGRDGHLFQGRFKSVVVFDKTGTLTTGQPVIESVAPLNGSAEIEVLRIAAVAERGTDHPLGRAVLRAAHDAGAAPSDAPHGANVEQGEGVSASDDSSIVSVGNERLARRLEIAISADAAERASGLRAKGQTALYVLHDGEVKGFLGVRDSVREEVAEALEGLRSLGVNELHMLTGDALEVATAVAAQVGLSREDVAADLRPGDKQSRVRELQAQGRRVCFVGDGANDGPALAEAHIGVSIGSRHNTVALETADIVLMRDGLRGLPFVIDLGRRTVRTINQNLLFFGLAYNVLLLALSGWGMLTPVLGAVGHNVGSVAVVLNSARLLRAPAGLATVVTR